MASEIERICRLLEKTFDKQPWYGPSIQEILSDLSPEIKMRHQQSTHSIIELVLHMSAWRTFAIKRLQGDIEFEISDGLNFPIPGSWEEAMANFRESQKVLVAAVKAFPEHRLAELVPSKQHRYTFYTLLHGIIQHDIYHVGQIALLKKLASMD